MPICRAEKPRFTSWPVRPFTSLEAAQSSSIMSVLVPSNKKNFKKNFKKKKKKFQKNFQLVLLPYYHKHSWIIFTNSEVGLVVRECWADKHNVVELAAERAVDLVHHIPRFA